ncbi:uncharacterized protein LOC119159971 isoform X2 [Rhipicephalus microplus]|uniref:uncharacterized protein LOC119159971 isoform X2 n=1 Tax=Rhipicephalus microplus TaxID=6941 RepID=UPI003F6B3A03
MKSSALSARYLAPVLLAYTPRNDVERPSLILESSYEDYATELCTVDGLETPYGVVPANCTKSCLNGEGKTTMEPMLNGTLCIVTSNDELKKMKPYKNFSCLLGACKGGCCVGDNNCTWCVKYPYGNIVVRD